MRVATWNVAAINNNPFEYWVTHPDPAYRRVMEAVEGLVEAPGARDVPVGSVLSDQMVGELRARLEAEGWEGVEEMDRRWREDLSLRPIVTGFLRDPAIGKKRLASMPDRVTNTIGLADGGTACRPAVVNAFTGDLGSVAAWWPLWLRFLFDEALPLPARGGGPPALRRPIDLIPPLSRAKYPDVSEAEEAASRPLQALCLAIFDAVLVHALNEAAPGAWLPLKLDLVQALVTGKPGRTAQVIAAAARGGHDAVFLQEASAGLVEALGRELADTHLVVAPAAMDSGRAQNSVAVLSRAAFDASTVHELSAEAAALVAEAGGAVAPGDLLAFSVKGAGENAPEYLLASFHGDTNGLQTAPVVRALHALARVGPGGPEGGGPRLVLVAGLDANTHWAAPGAPPVDPAKSYPVEAFASDLESLGLATCWPTASRWQGARTTHISRTYLQPQLNKACRARDVATKADRNPKDHVVFPAGAFVAVGVQRDNTGEGTFEDDASLPTVRWPSDHALVSVELKAVVPPWKVNK